MLVNQCNEKSGQCLSVLLQLPLERLKTMTIRKSVAHPSQHHLLQVIFYEILMVHLDFCEKKCFQWPPSGQWQVSKHFKEATVMDR